ncbi:hypothetical protein [Alsobacter metallidurans]|uniref:hypothetical protein n=1 Tax=Alsobacter metallidurans TaxID=340221 RepID=UPI0016694875|nr:hypothetical protein [Alsobacter metallidurans]
MLRFFRHPIHRATAVVLLCAAVLGYATPGLIVEPNLTSAILVGAAVLGLIFVAYRLLSARRRPMA